MLSKARARWGVDVFEALFAWIVAQCQLAGLIEGKKLHMDGKLMDANASNKAVLKGCPELICAQGEEGPLPRRYKPHRAVDDAYGVITATETIPPDVEKNAKLMVWLTSMNATRRQLCTVVADRQYGTGENLRR